MALWVRVNVLCALVGLALAGDTASFYGGSYVAVPLQDARSTTELRLRFRTRRPDALLVLAAGRTDYCLVRLETGRLKIHINLGAGETEVASPKGLRLDDAQWHDVVIERRDAAFTLTLDGVHVVKENLPGRFFELNIHYGLFLGGQGDFSELFLGHLESLRGCLADVHYNGVDVLARARERQGAVDVVGVTWSCAAEFDALPTQPISFVEDGAFVALHKAVTRTGARWQLELKTYALFGVLLYNTGLASRSDFVAVELTDGRLRLVVDKGAGAVQLLSARAVSDGRWHAVTVQFNPTFLEINVDGGVASARLPHGGNRYLDLADTAYVGGVELNKRARARAQGVLAADTSFKGCMKNMVVEGKRLGIPDARVTQGILPDCVWEYPCVDEPCVPGGQCLQQGLNAFRCECAQPLCVKPDYSANYSLYSKPSLPHGLEMLALSPLQVLEGESAAITPKQVGVVLDYPKFGVRDTGVLLRLVETPKHGLLSVDGRHRDAGHVFTLLDMAKDKVRYLHDGSESTRDGVEFELELSPAAGFTLPSYLQGRHRFVLPVNVTPVNDAPSLVLPPDRVLRLAQGTRTRLTKELLTAHDPDSDAAQLVYTVLGDVQHGHVERAAEPGVAVETFTQLAVDQGELVYVDAGAADNGDGVRQLALQVSDGLEAGPAAILRVAVHPLVLRLAANTGVLVTLRGSAIITRDNLSFVADADDPTLDVRFDVVKSAQFGELQRLRGETQWTPTDYFTSAMLARGQLRYQHLAGEPRHDEFKFKVSVLRAAPATVYDFRVTFARLHVVAAPGAHASMNGTRSLTLGEAHAHYTTEPLPVDAGSVVFTVHALPRFGVLRVDQQPIQPGQSFTQRDLSGGRMSYQLFRKCYSPFRDEFTFKVTALEAEPKLGSVSVVFVPEASGPASPASERAQVVEGGRVQLLPTHLGLRAPSGVNKVTFNVTRAPTHGRLDVMDDGAQPNTAPMRRDTSWFTLSELLAERLWYAHDDSESRGDAVHYLALSDDADADFQQVGVARIDVQLRNDNTPARAVDRVFHVVTGGERLLTGKDLRYEDADIDTTPKDIMYTRRGIPNGGIFRASEPTTPLFEFSQDDLDEGRVLFRHEGGDLGQVGLWITDGQFYANGVLDVRASPPFVQVNTNTGAVVRALGQTVLTSGNLSAETNVNAPPDRLAFDVLSAPRAGRLTLGGDPRPVALFTQRDLDDGRLGYQHEDLAEVADTFRFRVSVEGVSTEGSFALRMFPVAFWQPLMVTANRTIHVEESTSVVVSAAFLNVSNPGVPSSDVTYLVVTPPAHGYLEVETETGEVDEARSARGVEAFDQATVDEGRLHYVQTAANQSGDELLLDVTNGIVWLRGLRLAFLVVPDAFYVHVQPLTVVEGAVVTLAPGSVSVLTDYYRDRVTDYRVIAAPAYGRMQLSSRPDVSVERFSARDLTAGIVQYAHDGSETAADKLTLAAVAGDKTSAPATLLVVVQPVNDLPPHVLVNAPLSFFEGAGAIITAAHLAAVDEDTPAENLTFTVSGVQGGNVALITALTRPVDSFTQAQIDANQVVFVHAGGRSGGFDVTVSDGVKTTSPLRFVARVRAVTLRRAFLTPLHAFPLRKQCLSIAQLLFSAADRRPVTFHVTRPPALGALLLEGVGGASVEAINFTQGDVNASRVCYDHRAPFFGLSTNDSFLFDVHADFATPLRGQTLDIDVSVASGALDQFVNAPTITVIEGGTGVVSINVSAVATFLEAHAELTAPALWLTLTGSPQHGTVLLSGDGSNATAADEFEPAQFDAGRVLYKHDHSDSLDDALLFSLLLRPSDVLLCNITVKVNVTPVNDQPFALSTPSPHLSVVRGQTAPVTRLQLLAEDADTPPEELVYEVISGPTQGQLITIENVAQGVPTSASGNASLARFTQADVDAARVAYRHTGAATPDKFYFRVWDGAFNPVYTVFNIRVLPALLNATSESSVRLEQGSNVATVTVSHLQVWSNAPLDLVHFNVTTPPRHGVLYVRDVVAVSWTHTDLATNSVLYMQTDMTAPGDAFSLLAWLRDGPSQSVSMNVTVTPLLTIGSFAPAAGSRTRIGLDVLDATPLAKLTGSNPTFQVLRRPRLGRLKKVVRSSGERRDARERDVARFTHHELAAGLIFYVARRLPPDATGASLDDSIAFRLAASIYQPALGELVFRVSTPMAAASPPPLAPGAPDSREGGGGGGNPGGSVIAGMSSRLPSAYVLLVTGVLALVVITLLIVAIVRCRNGRRHAKQPLPAPPPTLEPRLEPLGTPTPQCKVVPLGALDAHSDLAPRFGDMSSARYPYGAADEQDWSSFEASELAFPARAPNPLLRRNQYWV